MFYSVARTSHQSQGVINSNKNLYFRQVGAVSTAQKRMERAWRLLTPTNWQGIHTPPRHVFHFPTRHSEKHSAMRK